MNQEEVVVGKEFLMDAKQQCMDKMEENGTVSRASIVDFQQSYHGVAVAVNNTIIACTKMTQTPKPSVQENSAS